MLRVQQRWWPEVNKHANLAKIQIVQTSTILIDTKSEVYDMKSLRDIGTEQNSYDQP